MMINISGAPPNSITATPPPDYYDNYSGPANPACFLELNNSLDWAGQSFTTTTKYNLAQVELWIKKGPGSNVGTVYVEVFAVDGNGHPTGDGLARGHILNADVSEDFGWVSCDMDIFSLTYYILNAATKYCLVVWSLALDVDNTLIWSCGGDGSGLPGGDQEWSINGGTSWATDTTRDQLFRCYAPDFLDNYSGTALPWVGGLKLDSASDWAGQSFTAMKSYCLNRVDIWCKKDVGDNVGDLIVALYDVDGDGHPEGVALATGIIPNADVPETYAWVPCSDISAYNVVVDTKYCIVVHGFSLNATNYIFWSYDNDGGLSAYAGGDVEWSVNSGGSWSTTTTFDLLFRCFPA